MPHIVAHIPKQGDSTMASMNNRNLTLQEEGSNVTITVSYNVTFTPLELHLAAHGLRLRDRITVIGVDPEGGFTGTLLHTFPAQEFQPVNGTRSHTITKTRASLNEDTEFFDHDEIRARIVLRAVGLPTPLVDQFTDQEVLEEAFPFG
jgi:hypothetical protein